MTDRSDDKTTAGQASGQADAPAKAMPARPGEALDVQDAAPAKPPGPDATTPAGSKPAIDSTLVGNSGGLPAANPKGAAAGSDVKTADNGPLRLGDPVKSAAPSGSSIPSVGAPPRTAATVESAPSAPKAPAPSPTPERIVEVRRGGFAPMVLGGIVAAGLGAGATWLAIPNLPEAWRPETAAQDTTALTQAIRAEIAPDIEAQATAAADAAATRAAAASLASETAGLLDQARTAGAEAATRLIAEAPATAQPDGEVQATLSAQAQQLATLSEQFASLSENVAAAGNAPAAEGAAAPVDLGPLQQRLDALTAEVEALASRPAMDPVEAERLSQLASDADSAATRIQQIASEAETRLGEVEDRTAELTRAADEAARRARAAAATSALADAMQTGAPRTAALAELEEAGIAAPPALRADIPTAEQLAAEYPAAARAALRAALRSESASGEGSVIGNFLRAQTGARSVTPREGNDSDAVLSRAGDAVSRGDIAGALAQLDALPEAARAPMQDWTARARSYAEAQAALHSLTAPAADGQQPAETTEATPATSP